MQLNFECSFSLAIFRGILSQLLYGCVKHRQTSLVTERRYLKDDRLLKMQLGAHWDFLKAYFFWKYA